MTFFNKNAHQSCVFVWKIENFDMILRLGAYKSPDFIVETTSPLKYHLELDFRQSGEYITFSLVQNSDEEFPFYYEISLFRANKVMNLMDEPKLLTSSKSVAIDSSLIFNNCKDFIPTFGVRCHIWGSIAKIYRNYIIAAKTRIHCVKYSFNWRINRFSTHVKDAKFTKYVKLGSNRFELSVRFDKVSNDKDDVPIEVRLLDGNKCFVKCEISLFFNSNGVRDDKKSEKLLEKGEIWELPSLFNRQYLQYNPVDELFLRFEMTASECGNQSFSEIVQNMEIPFNFTERNVTQSNVNISTKRFCDVKLQVADTAIHAHKFVLCSNSPVFDNLLSKNTAEVKSTNVIPLTDVEPNVLEDLVSFLHTETFDWTCKWEEVTKLYTASKQYQILSLQEACSLFLLINAFPEDVPKVIDFANKQGDSLLKKLTEELQMIYSC